MHTTPSQSQYLTPIQYLIQSDRSFSEAQRRLVETIYHVFLHHGKLTFPVLIIKLYEAGTTYDERAVMQIITKLMQMEPPLMIEFKGEYEMAVVG